MYHFDTKHEQEFVKYVMLSLFCKVVYKIYQFVCYKFLIFLFLKYK